jgi:hypothetical protein
VCGNVVVTLTVCSAKLDGGLGGVLKVICAAALCADIARATIASCNFM